MFKKHTLIRQILKSMLMRRISRFGDSLCSQTISEPVLAFEVPAEEENDEDQQGVAADVRGEGDEVAWSVPFEEYLGTCVLSKGGRFVSGSERMGLGRRGGMYRLRCPLPRRRS